MKVGIDAHAIGSRAGGNETYMRELLAALAESNEDIEWVGLINPSETWSPGGRVAAQPLPQTPSAIRVPIVLPWLARKHRFDLLHTQYAAPPWCPCPTVVSVHDIGWVRFPELFPPLLRSRLALLTPGTLRRAARIFVLTDAIKREIADVYEVAEERMDVVAPSVDPRFFAEASAEDMQRIRARYDLPEAFVLYVGALQPRKNLARLATAFAQLRDHGLPHALVLTGKRAWLHSGMLEAIESLQLRDRLRFTGYVDAEDLPTLIRAADAFAYVSLYEGFGLPALEALASGVPCVVSNDPAIAEVCGGAAISCDPLDLDDMERALVSALTDDPLRQRLHRAGPTQAARFTRASMAAAAVQGYREALRGH
ncbi:MAG: glycosyl transferase [Candidatus Hydrogenedentota bacterium]